VFVKPAIKKAFPAAVHRPAEPLAPAFDDSEPVLMSEVVQFVSEMRCWMLDGRVVTSAVYRDESDEPRDWKAAHGVARKAAELSAPRAVVIDVGQRLDGMWSVVEANPASSSGIYGASPILALDVIERATIPKES
jgi:hypothetical protein